MAWRWRQLSISTRCHTCGPSPASSGSSRRTRVRHSPRSRILASTPCSADWSGSRPTTTVCVPSFAAAGGRRTSPPTGRRGHRGAPTPAGLLLLAAHARSPSRGGARTWPGPRRAGGGGAGKAGRRLPARLHRSAVSLPCTDRVRSRISGPWGGIFAASPGAGVPPSPCRWTPVGRLDGASAAGWCSDRGSGLTVPSGTAAAGTSPNCTACRGRTAPSSQSEAMRTLPAGIAVRW